MKTVPVLGQVLGVVDRYPRISAWLVLATGIVVLLVYEARDVGLSAGNWVALIVASIVVAGLCIWIVSWEDEDESADKPIRITSETRPVEPSAIPLAEVEVVNTEAESPSVVD